MTPQRQIRRSRWHEFLLLGSLVAGCSAGPSARRLPPQDAPLIGPTVPPSTATQIGNGSMVVVAREAPLFLDSALSQPAIRVGTKENVLFGVVQVVGSAVEVMTVGEQPGACHAGADGFWSMEMRFWVDASHLVPVLAESMELGVWDEWTVTAHAGAEVTPSGILYRNFLAPVPEVRTELSYTPRTPEGTFASWEADELKTPFPVGDRWTYRDQAGVRHTTVSVDTAQFDEDFLRIDDGCMSLRRPVEPRRDAALANIFGVGGLGIAGGLASKDGVTLPEGTVVRWGTTTPAGRLTAELTLYDTWRVGELVCAKRKLPADPNMAADDFTFCALLP